MLIQKYYDCNIPGRLFQRVPAHLTTLNKLLNIFRVGRFFFFLRGACDQAELDYLKNISLSTFVYNSGSRLKTSKRTNICFNVI